MIYSVGLNNVGSYQVSGVPFLNTQTIADGNLQEINLERVSKNVGVQRKSSSAGELFVGLGSSSFVQTSALNIAVDDFYETSTNIAPYANHSISFWIDTSNIANSEVVVLQGGFNNDSIYLSKSGDDLVLKHENSTNTLGTQTNSAVVQNFPFNGWNHIVFSFDESSSGIGIDAIGNLKIYVNSQTAISVIDHRRKFSGWRSLKISNATAGEYAGPYDEITFWSKALTDGDVVELYNSLEYKDPISHSAAGDLQHWWAFETDPGLTVFTPNSTPDNINTIQDRMNNGVELDYNTGSNSTNDGPSFVQGPTGWKALSTSKMMRLSSSLSSISSDIKIKKIYLYADSGNVVAELNISLTNIPSSRLSALPE